ncbi:ArsB/NhaD family transporter [Metabacillus halosaccharovorans]|uniref:ArsB/NhaD family transporter n=1 Tax=Metabacillus halosaccharovorans TaxID=930124 RepID=A0ABT3DEG4_9BACI|nr:ArsB/NhaD family transporter [Metabacillus halosaccharovorans]MCM3441998.1 ArsB/NhaD family transporter [Metabacillus halosaccharovorans]MCV9885248.1 ArsB/NhaD family transporter [Metabacillus halosaccharovorans]
MFTVLTVIIFLITYIVIMTEKIDRALAAGLGGIAMLIVGIYDVNKAFVTYIDWNTIALLFAMMLIVIITSQTGVFEFLAIVMAKMVKGRPIPLLIVITILTAIGSAFLANVTMVLLLVPIILTIVRMIHIPAIPYLISIIIASNIGGTATLIGDPPNIMIGQAVEHLTFNAFLIHLSPIVLLIFFVILGYLIFVYWDKLKANHIDQKKLTSIRARDYLKVTPALPKSVSVLIMTIIGFMLNPLLHIDLTSIALAGALLLLLLTHDEYKPDEVFKQVEWGTLFFFIGLFMLIGGLEEVGIIDELARGLVFYTEGDLPKTSMLILWMTGVLSGFVDNIPFVAAMIPVILEFKDYGMTNLDPLWWSLALGACLGGNGTLLGASSNLVVAGLAAKEKEDIKFIEFLKVGFPIVIISLGISSVYIYFRYLIHFTV